MSHNPAPQDLPVAYLRGVGPKKAVPFEKVGVRTLRDLLYYVPRRYLDRSHAVTIGELTGLEPDPVTVIGTITDARIVPSRGGKSRYETLLEDPSGALKLVWFRHTNRMRKWLVPGYSAAFTGKVQLFGGSLQIVHPDIESLSKGEAEDLLRGEGRWVALYPCNREFEKMGLDTHNLRRLMDRLVGEYLPGFPDFWSEEERLRWKIPSLETALQFVHRPKNSSEHDTGWSRLKFDEFFMLQLVWAISRKRNRERKRGIVYPDVGKTTRELISRLPFTLTDTQRKVLREIWADMQKAFPMSRLLQGDVGSGKTIVALVAMTIAIENGFQAALMVPTEILAEQHYLTSSRFLQGLGISVYLLTGNTKAAARREIQEKMENGEPGIFIGTHALIQESVEFGKLGFVVIDEQHRFGVAQRLKLMHSEQKIRPDVLVMTATPIPRSLGLAYYGDLEVSKLDESPPGRGLITTTPHNGQKERLDVYSAIKKKVLSGGRAYVVFPLVEESEKLDLQSATESFEWLKKGVLRGCSLGLLHGRMRIEEKEEAMRKFASGETQVLVSTTVIEVGVDVPEATEMVIEHAERFGLAQLHQLRGRIGRGGQDSHCYLIAYPPVSETARQRIRTLIRTTDGFQVAEEDLRLRGTGDFFGVRQHGLPELRFANIITDQLLLVRARQAAEEFLETDPDFKKHPLFRKEFLRIYGEKVAWLEVG